MELLEKKKYWVWLSLIEGIGYKRKQQLLEIYQTAEKIYNATEKELKQLEEKTIQTILDSKIKINLNKHLSYMTQNEIDIISIEDKEYPQKLKQIYDPPISLYIKGNKEILNQKTIAIIGCRDATNYGKKVASYLAYNLAKKESGYVIVSGLAKGIDSYGHIGSLTARGKTIAVMGTGLDMIYPKENEVLADKILNEEGAIISEYPLGTKPEKMNFPARNRIISGLSQSVVVVEAKEKSGTLITVDYALEQGRDVFVVPGNINSDNSAGTNDLIKQGAKLITSYMDILEEY